MKKFYLRVCRIVTLNQRWTRNKVYFLFKIDSYPQYSLEPGLISLIVYYNIKNLDHWNNDKANQLIGQSEKIVTASYKNGTHLWFENCPSIIYYIYYYSLIYGILLRICSLRNVTINSNQFVIYLLSFWWWNQIVVKVLHSLTLT